MVVALLEGKSEEAMHKFHETAHAHVGGRARSISISFAFPLVRIPRTDLMKSCTYSTLR